MDSKPKRETSAWAKAVAAHIKSGGIFPKKGSADYDIVRKAADAMKEAAPVKQTKKDKEDEKLREEVKVLKTKKTDNAPRLVIKEEDETPVVVEKKTRGPYKKKVAEHAEPIAPVVVEKKKRGPYKKKESAAPMAAAGEPAIVVDTKTETKKENVAVMDHNIHICQTIPLSRLTGSHGKTIPFSNFEVKQM
jgi:hypothetical protein